MGKIIPVSSLNSAYQMSGEGCCDTVSTSGLPLRKIPRKKIHCILPSSPWLADSKTNVPLGVLYIAGLLREQGHEIVVTSMLDKRYEGNIHLPEHVMDSDVHMFGFCTPQFGEALELAAYIKDRNPDALLVAGGPHPSYEPKEVKEATRQDAYHYKGTLTTRRNYAVAGEKPLFDTVIVMEGEVQTLQMLSDWDAGKLQPYYYGDKADAMDLDAIPFPAWDLLPHDHIYNHGSAVMKKDYFPNHAHPEASSAVMSMIGARGCPYKCFAAGTGVRMSDGASKNIEDIVVGDSVEAFSIDTGRLAPRRVSMVGSRDAEDVYEVRLADRTVLQVTGDHPFVTADGWGFPRDFKAGTFVRRVRSASSTDGSTVQQDVFSRMFGRSDSGFETRGQESCEASRSPSENLGDSQVTGARTIGASKADSRIRQNAVSRLWSDTRGSSIASHEVEQSDAQTGRREASRRDASAGVPRRETPSLSASIREGFSTGTRAVLAAGISRIADRLQRGSNVLGRAMSIWAQAQSRYEAFISELTSCDSFQWPVLAYVGGYRDAASRLSERRMVGATLLGREQQRSEYGACPGARVPGDWVRVESVTFVGRSRVYNISVEHDETFIAGGVAVHNCTYCSTPWIGQRPRYRSPANIITEMSLVIDKGVRQFKMQDDTFSLHRTKLRELGLAIKSAFGPDDFAYRIHTRVNTMDDHVAESLKMMNTKVTCFGIESGSQRVLDANQKNTTVAQNTAALINAKKHGFYTIGFLVIGMSGETLETIEETKQWLLSVKPYLDSCNVAVGIPYPGSRWWTHPKESGIDIVDYNYDNQWIVGFAARDEILVRPHGASVDDMFKMKSDFFKFMVDHGWAKAEWDEDARIKKQQQVAVDAGVLAQSGFSGH